MTMHSSLCLTESPTDIVTGNFFDKYGSRNPLHRWLVNGFLDGARALVHRTAARKVLEIGCAAGELAERILPLGARSDRATVDYVGIDISPGDIVRARQRLPRQHFEVASACCLPFPDRTFDLVIACEVFEHLTDPATALDEAARVARRWLLVSVPWEPVWRLLNIARGRYLRTLGNTPGHVRHFSRPAIRHLVRQRFVVVAERRPLPWTMLLAEVRRT